MAIQSGLRCPSSSRLPSFHFEDGLSRGIAGILFLGDESDFSAQTCHFAHFLIMLTWSIPQPDLLTSCMSIFMQSWCKMATRSGMRYRNGIDWMGSPTCCKSAHTDRFRACGQAQLAVRTCKFISRCNLCDVLADCHASTALSDFLTG